MCEYLGIQYSLTLSLPAAFFFVYKLVATAIMAQNLTRGTTRLKYICLTTQVCLWIVNFACEGIQWVDHRLQLINSFCSGTACLFLAGVALYYSRVIVREVQTTRSAGAKRSGTGDKMKKFNRSVRLMMVMGFCSAVILYVFVYIRATGDTSYPARVEDFSVGAMVTQHGTMLSVNTVTNYVFWVRNSINEVQWASQSGKARLGGGSMLRPSEVMKSMDSRRRARSMNSRGRPNLSSTLRVSTIGVASASAIQIEESAKFVDVTFDAAEVRGRPRGAELIIDIDVDNADAEYGGATNSDLILPGAIH